MAYIPSDGSFQTADTRAADAAWIANARKAGSPDYVELAPPTPEQRNTYLQSLSGPGYAVTQADDPRVAAAAPQQLTAAATPVAGNTGAAPQQQQPRALSSADSGQDNIVVGSGYQAQPGFTQNFGYRGLR